MCALRRGLRVTLSFHFILVIFEGKKCMNSKNVLQNMVPTIFLVDFSETADDRLCKLQYDDYLHLRYDIPVGERIE